MPLRIVIDEQIPYLRGVLEPHADVVYLAGTEINRQACLEADALIVRTRTQCNAALLEGTKVSLIASATIGLDHIDVPYCQAKGIRVVNAPGCNAWAVVQWVISCINLAYQHSSWAMAEVTMGIVGAGAIGRRLAATFDMLGLHWKACDPPLARFNPEYYCSLDEICQTCDIITLHVPYTHEGAHATAGLIDRNFLRRLSRRPFIFNASRGGIVNDYALTEALQCKWIRGYCLDVYEDEPDVPPAVVESALACTPHIAGYSVEGKLAATTAVLRAVSQHYRLPTLKPTGVPTNKPVFNVGFSLQDLAKTFDLRPQSLALKAAPQRFEQLRSEYAYRHDWRGYEFGSPRVHAVLQQFEDI